MSVFQRVLFGKISRWAPSAASVTNCKKYSTEQGYMKSSLPDVDIPKVHITEYIFNEIGKWPNKIAFECGFTGRKYTYDDVRIKSTNLNKALRKKLKLQKGDMVAMLLPNVPEFTICIFGTFLAGLKLTTINPTYTPDEIRRQLIDADVKAIITLTDFWSNAKTAASDLNKDIPIITIKTQETESLPQGAINFQELVNEKFDIPDASLLSLDKTLFMPYSSGTTGLPKGVKLTSQNIAANIAQYNCPELAFIEEATDTHQDVVPCVLPMFHIYGFSTGMALMKRGCKVITLPKFTTDSYLECIVKYNPHILILVPPIIIFLYTHPAVKAEYLQSVRTVMSGAAPLGALDENKFRQKIQKPVNIVQGYGLSETSPVVTVVPVKVQGKYPGSIGHPVPNTLVKIIAPDDPEGKHLGPNHTGELLIKGPQVTKGYHNRPEESKDMFLDGWLRTGDLAYYDNDNMFYIADRIKELIKVKGFQVPPAELEEILRDFPGVADAAVIGIPHEYKGEVPRAYVVPKTGSIIDPKTLDDYVSSKVAKHKRLMGGIAIVDSIPKNASGKILRRQLKLKYQEESA